MTQTIAIEPVSAQEQGTPPSNPDFGSNFADHMFVQSYTAAGGWDGATIKKLENFSIHPAAAVLHYGQEIFDYFADKNYDINDLIWQNPSVKALICCMRFHSLRFASVTQ